MNPAMIGEKLTAAAEVCSVCHLPQAMRWRWTAAVVLAGLAWRVLGDARGPPRGYNVNGF